MLIGCHTDSSRLLLQLAKKGKLSRHQRGTTPGEPLGQFRRSIPSAAEQHEMLSIVQCCLALTVAPLPPRLKNLKFETADVSSLPEVSAFFVDSFWLASTTFPGIELSASDRRQLMQKVADDLGPRYGIKDNDKRPTMMGGRRGFPSRSLFETRLLLARDSDGSIVGCAGIEAAFYVARVGQLCRSAQADRIVRAELNAMDDDEADLAAEVYAKDGIGGLAKGITLQKFTSDLEQPYLVDYKACSLLANLAVAPSYRRTGLGRALCDACVQCTTEEWKMDEIALQVEEANRAAVVLYQKEGYNAVFRAESATALRLQPSEPSPFSNLPGPLSALAPENKKLLKEVSSPTVTMSKVVA